MTFLHAIDQNGWRGWILLAIVVSLALCYLNRMLGRQSDSHDATAWILGTLLTLLLFMVAP